MSGDDPTVKRSRRNALKERDKRSQPREDAQVLEEAASRVLADHHPVHDHAVHADQRIPPDPAAVQDGPVADMAACLAQVLLWAVMRMRVAFIGKASAKPSSMTTPLRISGGASLMAAHS